LFANRLLKIRPAAVLAATSCFEIHLASLSSGRRPTNCLSYYN
jgi:hypothetical protein